jgi:hypothetical protein
MILFEIETHGSLILKPQGQVNVGNVSFSYNERDLSVCQTYFQLKIRHFPSDLISIGRGYRIFETGGILPVSKNGRLAIATN